MPIIDDFPEPIAVHCFLETDRVFGDGICLMELQKETSYGANEDRKRQMKTPLQLEILEQVFAEEKYPSESVRARLSIQLGLSNRQLKMWFCHRRLKDRKSKGDDEGPGSLERGSQQPNGVLSYRHSAIMSSPSRLSDHLFPKEEQVIPESYYFQEDFASKIRKRLEGSLENGPESPRRKKNRQITCGEDSSRLAELQAIASVEAQLGEPLRWDSPCLGVEFDPLPSGAFSSFNVSHCKMSPLRISSESNNHSKLDFSPKRDSFLCEKETKTRKFVPVENDHRGCSSQSGSVSVQEYQFIPERPTGRDGMVSASEKPSNAKTFQVSESLRAGLIGQDSLSRGSENLTVPSGLGGKLASSTSGVLLQRDGYKSLGLPHPEHLHQDILPTLGFANHSASHMNPYHLIPTLGSLHSLEKPLVFDDEEACHWSKKRKSEEIRVAKELEARRKRLQKELEREELARRKREDQLQREREKELEKILREKQREDEKLMREKQREDERIQRERQREDERLQREARRESERQERFMLKEAQRLEREREKESSKRLKEATRLKAAIERATARRLARECVELIDDERLELLEAAAASQGLPSIYLLDGETLQGLDRYKDVLKRFPPAAVKTKKPLSIHPWKESQQNLGNLFMVWRFLISFADVLGLWPFTLDELVQAFHDYESRLLSEVHIALFKTIVKDVEDMAKASANAGAVNQYTAASTIGGGHTHLVEAAFACGFDYRHWTRYLNALTWPEILRQFSLAAGFGGSICKQPQSGRSVDDGQFGHYSKPNSNLNCSRSGVAAVSAPVSCRLKANLFRKNGARLTPGTVKFAAFHVLSVEGSHGLPIVDIVARIEKYGLRDLSKSKTPESSVAAALSRDTTFFERVAPSTYCVKQAYRKNPEDAESLLQSALERIRLFQSGTGNVFDEQKDIEGCDEVEGETSSADDIGDFTIADLHGVMDNGKPSFSLKGDEIDESCTGEPWVQGLCEGEYSALSVEERLNALVALIEIVNEGNTIRMALEERMEASIAFKRQMWTEAQLDKRRSKEEIQLKSQPHAGDDSIKNEATNMCPVSKDWKNPANVSVEHRKSPSFDREQGVHDCMNQETSSNLAFPEKSRAQLKADIDFRAEELYVFRSLPLGLDRRRNRYWQFVTSYGTEDPGCGRIFLESSEDGNWEVIDTEEAFNALLMNLDTRGVREAHLHGVLLKLEDIIRQGMRTLPSSTNVERRSSAYFSVTPPADASSVKGSNNGACSAPLKEENMSFGDGMVILGKETCRHVGAIQVHVGSNPSEKHTILNRYREFDKWFWSRETPHLSCLVASRLEKKRSPELLAKCDSCHDLYWHGEKHCLFCHMTFEFSSKKDISKFVEHVSHCERRSLEKNTVERHPCLLKKLPCRMQLLKSHFLCIESAIPAKALRPSWSEQKRRMWASSLKHASSPSDLLQLLSELEIAIHQQWLSRRFEPAKEILISEKGTIRGQPSTTAAVAMRLMEFDSAVFYSEEQRQRSSQRRDSIPERGVLPLSAKKEQIQNSEAPSSLEGLKETNCNVGKHGGKRDAFAEYQEGLKVKHQGFKKQSDAVIIHDWQRNDFSSHPHSRVGKTEDRRMLKMYVEHGKQPSLPSQDLKGERASFQKSNGKHQAQGFEKSKLPDHRANCHKSYKIRDGVKEMVLEEYFQREENEIFEDYRQKEWASDSDGLGSMEKKNMDLNADDDDDDGYKVQYNVSKADKRWKQDECSEDSDTEDDDSDTTGSESYDESE
ncbi:hypothetical protein KP509_38G016400 [Ceratopteris richardii]|uniref:Uncharacterized protein n=1 Tax=Ceratopteris richardii TaxID=49495 RepID=A0A8T2Q1W7_CERRI|nr:hypothetical protein KP509_38G016400 [Ceratopteris richardii]